MTHTQLKAFLAVLEAGSFSAAALELGLAQSSVSRALAELERDLGVRLLRRGRHGATPTEAGRRIAVHARSVLALHDAIREEAALLAGRLRGRLRVAAYPSVVRAFVGDVLIAFRMRHPEVEVVLDELTPSGVEEAVCEGRADLGFALLPSAEALIAFEVDRAACVAVVPLDWPQSSLGVEELATTPFLVYGDRVCERIILGYVRDLVGPLEPAQRLHENATILAMVARGQGVSIMTEAAAAGHPEVRGVALPRPLERVTGAVVRPENLGRPVVSAMLSTLRTRFRIERAPATPVAPVGTG